jgi:hypothetical protein
LINITLLLRENKYYTLTIKDGTNIVYRDKIFCTNQTLIHIAMLMLNTQQQTNIKYMNSYILNLSAYTSPTISESKKGDC